MGELFLRFLFIMFCFLLRLFFPLKKREFLFGKKDKKCEFCNRVFEVLRRILREEIIDIIE